MIFNYDKEIIELFNHKLKSETTVVWLDGQEYSISDLITMLLIKLKLEPYVGKERKTGRNIIKFRKQKKQ